jgi:hypothetical protein
MKISFVLLLVLLATPDGAKLLGQSAGTFTPAGSMITPRVGHTAALLYNGKVLIAGGYLTQPGVGPSLGSVSAELYDPSTGTFTATGDMTTARIYHTATLLPNGKVLIAGGLRTRSAEVYDPSSGTFIATGDTVNENVDIPVNAILLADGKVLIAHDGTAELYDSVTGTFSATAGSPSPPLDDGPSLLATLLDDGRVLLANESYAELYDPASGTFGLTGAPNAGVLCSDGFAGAPLTNGKVLVAGGYCEDINPGSSAGAELYDPSTGTFTPTGDMTAGRDFHTATPLGDGTVLIAGGMPIAVSTTAELYDPATGMFSRTGNMTTSRLWGHTSTLLLDGTVLIAGGVDNGSLNGGVLASAELYKPSVPVPAPALF